LDTRGAAESKIKMNIDVCYYLMNNHVCYSYKYMINIGTIDIL